MNPNLEEVNSCPVCETSKRQLFLTCKDYTVSKADFTIVECATCRFAFTSPRPFEKDLGFYYESEDYISHSNTSKGIVSRLYERVR
jgi:hypothetical protein